MKTKYDRKTKVLTATFKRKELVGFDNRGLPQYNMVERTQTFFGLNKQECVYKARVYIAGIDVIHRRKKLYDTSVREFI